MFVVIVQIPKILGEGCRDTPKHTHTPYLRCNECYHISSIVLSVGVSITVSFVNICKFEHYICQ